MPLLGRDAVAALIAVAMFGCHLWTDRQPTIYSEIHAHVSAVVSGDRSALRNIIADGGRAARCS